MACRMYDSTAGGLKARLPSQLSGAGPSTRQGMSYAIVGISVVCLPLLLRGNGHLSTLRSQRRIET